MSINFRSTSINFRSTSIKLTPESHEDPDLLEFPKLIPYLRLLLEFEVLCSRCCAARHLEVLRQEERSPHQIADRAAYQAERRHTPRGVEHQHRRGERDLLPRGERHDRATLLQ